MSASSMIYVRTNISYNGYPVGEIILVPNDDRTAQLVADGKLDVLDGQPIPNPPSGASGVSVNPSGFVEATNVQAFLDELMAELPTQFDPFGAADAAFSSQVPLPVTGGVTGQVLALVALEPEVVTEWIDAGEGISIPAGTYMPANGDTVDTAADDESLWIGRTVAGQTADLWVNQYRVSAGVYRRTGYANEKGELRSRAAAANSVAFRTQSFDTAPTATIFEVALSDNTVMVAGGKTMTEINAVNSGAGPQGYIGAYNTFPGRLYISPTEPVGAAENDIWLRPA